MPKHFTTLIVVAMLLGIAVGYACNIAFPDPKMAATIAGYISLVTDLFLRLITKAPYKMLWGGSGEHISIAALTNPMEPHPSSYRR
jgi:hypothetical protein